MNKETITRRERRLTKIKELKRKGLSCQQIADELFICIRTVVTELNGQKDTFNFTLLVAVDAYSLEEAQKIIKRIQKKHIRILTT